MPTLEELKNMQIPVKTAISIIVFIVGAYSMIEQRYAHESEVSELKQQLDTQTKLLYEQQGTIQAALSGQLNDVSDQVSTLKKSHKKLAQVVVQNSQMIAKNTTQVIETVVSPRVSASFLPVEESTSAPAPANIESK
jgi:hypothetical protein